jgi:hypothetical protein|tara:strand:+ start:174 stop:359 length:186 start_codon:yes stop_codon:yes gene_type:complete
MTTLILIAVILGIYFLGKYAIEEGVRVERQKKFMEDMNKWDSGRSKDDPVNIWNKHKRKKK